jgi:hypothetical protein
MDSVTASVSIQICNQAIGAGSGTTSSNTTHSNLTASAKPTQSTGGAASTGAAVMGAGLGLIAALMM